MRWENIRIFEGVPAEKASDRIVAAFVNISYGFAGSLISDLKIILFFAVL